MSALILMDSDLRSDFGITPITDAVALSDYRIEPEMLDAEPGILFVAREDVRTLPLSSPLQILPGESAILPVDASHDFLRKFGSRVQLSGRSGLTQAGTDARVFFDDNGLPYVRVTNHGYAILGTDEGEAIDIGAPFVHSPIPTQGAELETFVADITYRENPSNPWRIVTPLESGLPYDAVAMPVERIFRSLDEQRNGNGGNGRYDRCLSMRLIPSGPEREALFRHIGLDPTPIHTRDASPRNEKLQTLLGKSKGLVISASQEIELPQRTGLVIQHAMHEGSSGRRRVTHLNSPLLKSHNRNGHLYRHMIMYETDGTPTSVIAYAYNRFSYA